MFWNYFFRYAFCQKHGLDICQEIMGFAEQHYFLDEDRTEEFVRPNTDAGYDMLYKYFWITEPKELAHLNIIPEKLRTSKKHYIKQVARLPKADPNLSSVSFVRF